MPEFIESTEKGFTIGYISPEAYIQNNLRDFGEHALLLDDEVQTEKLFLQQLDDAKNYTYNIYGKRIPKK